MKVNKKREYTSWGWRNLYSNSDNTLRFALYVYSDDEDKLYLSNVFVDESIRKQGWGNQILKYVRRYAATHCSTSLTLNVVKDSWQKEWYERKGFKYVSDYKENKVWLRYEI